MTHYSVLTGSASEAARRAPKNHSVLSGRPELKFWLAFKKPSPGDRRGALNGGTSESWGPGLAVEGRTIMRPGALSLGRCGKAEPSRAGPLSGQELRRARRARRAGAQ